MAAGSLYISARKNAEKKEAISLRSSASPSLLGFGDSRFNTYMVVFVSDVRAEAIPNFGQGRNSRVFGRTAKFGSRRNMLLRRNVRPRSSTHISGHSSELHAMRRWRFGTSFLTSPERGAFPRAHFGRAGGVRPIRRHHIATASSRLGVKEQAFLAIAAATSRDARNPH